MFMHAIVHNYSPETFPFFNFNLNVNEHRFNFRNDNDFHNQRTNSTLVQSMPLINYPATWNNLDQSLKSISSKITFKKCVKSELLDKYANFRCNRTLCLSCIESYS